jgi:hypothetical protein
VAVLLASGLSLTAAASLGMDRRTLYYWQAAGLGGLERHDVTSARRS